MACCCTCISKIMILGYFLLVSIWMVSDSLHWENDLLRFYNQIAIGVHTGTGHSISLTGKILTMYSKVILQTIGTLGVLTVFFVMYGSQKAARLLFAVSSFISLIYFLSIESMSFNAPSCELGNFMKFVAVNAGLLSFC